MTSRISKKHSGISTEKSSVAERLDSAPDDPLAALAASVRREKSQQCSGCAPDIEPVVARWLDLMAAHPERPGAKMDALHAHLVGQYGYRYTQAALTLHAKHHDRERYERAKVR